MEASHLIASLASDSEHHAKSVLVARNEVEEREPVEILGLLVGNLNNLGKTMARQASQSSVSALSVAHTLHVHAFESDQPCGYPA